MLSLFATPLDTIHFFKLWKKLASVLCTFKDAQLGEEGDVSDKNRRQLFTDILMRKMPSN